MASGKRMSSLLRSVLGVTALFAYRLHHYNTTMSADAPDDLEVPDSDQIDSDIDALSATVKSSDQAEVRTELLAREQDIADLDRQNSLLQATTVHKIRLGPHPHDFCVELGSTDYISALDAYTAVMNKLLAFAQATPELKSANTQK